MRPFDPAAIETEHDPQKLDDLIAEMHGVRVLAEPSVAEWAARTITDEHLAELEDAMVRMTELLGNQPDAHFEANCDFHMTIARATGNRMVVQLMESLNDLMRASRRRRVVSYGGPLPARDPHLEIYEALAARDPRAAREAMTAHMLAAGKGWTGR